MNYEKEIFRIKNDIDKAIVKIMKKNNIKDIKKWLENNAVEYRSSNGTKFWFINDIKLTEDELNSYLLKKKLEKDLNKNSIVAKKTNKI